MDTQHSPVAAVADAKVEAALASEGPEAEPQSPEQPFQPSAAAAAPEQLQAPPVPSDAPPQPQSADQTQKEPVQESSAEVVPQQQPETTTATALPEVREEPAVAAAAPQAQKNAAEEAGPNEGKKHPRRLPELPSVATGPAFLKPQAPKPIQREARSIAEGKEAPKKTAPKSAGAKAKQNPFTSFDPATSLKQGKTRTQPLAAAAAERKKSDVEAEYPGPTPTDGLSREELAQRDEATEKLLCLMLRETSMSESWRESGEGKTEGAIRTAYSRTLGDAKKLLVEVERARRELMAVRRVVDKQQEDRSAVAEELKESLTTFILESASAARDYKARPIPARIIEQFRETSDELEYEIETERRANMALRHKVRSLDAAMKRRDSMRDGLHMIDFEQIKIENQAYTEKIEERNEELAKLQKKIDSTIQVTTHVKEKMSFVQVENERLKQELVGAERAVVQMRDALASSKIDRDALRAANVQLQKSNGLVGAMDLLRDFDGNRVALNEATARLQELRAEHAQVSARLAAASPQATLEKTRSASLLALGPQIITSRSPAPRQSAPQLQTPESERHVRFPILTTPSPHAR
eukprot:m51a1_g8758 hypothetical protein (583) ;mRNA; r:108496-110318